MRPTFGRGVLLASGALNFGLAVGVPVGLSVMFLDWQESFGSSRALTATVHSSCVGILFAGGVLAGFFVNWFGSRATVLLGTTLATVGMLLGAFATSIYFLLVTVGIIAGSGFCLLQLPCIPCTTRPFPDHPSLAISVCLVGASLSGLALPYLYTILVDVYSWRGSFIIISGIVLNTYILDLVMTSLVPGTEDELHVSVDSPETVKLVDKELDVTPNFTDAKPGVVEKELGPISKVTDAKCNVDSADSLAVCKPAGESMNGVFAVAHLNDGLPSCGDGDVDDDCEQSLLAGVENILQHSSREISNTSDPDLSAMLQNRENCVGKGHTTTMHSECEMNVDQSKEDVHTSTDAGQTLLQLNGRQTKSLEDASVLYDAVCSKHDAGLSEDKLALRQNLIGSVHNTPPLDRLEDKIASSQYASRSVYSTQPIDRLEDKMALNQTSTRSVYRAQPSDRLEDKIAVRQNTSTSVYSFQPVSPSFTKRLTTHLKQSPWRFLLDPLTWAILLFLSLALASLFSCLILLMDVASTKGFPEIGVQLIMINAVTATVGKLLAGGLGLWEGCSSFVLLSASGVLGSVTLFALGNASSVEGVMISVGVLGVALGTIVTVYPKCMLDLPSVDEKTYPLALGLGSTMEGVLDFVFPVLIGHAVDVTGSYALPLSLLGGASFFSSCVLLLVFLWSRQRLKAKGKDLSDNVKTECIHKH